MRRRALLAAFAATAGAGSGCSALRPSPSDGDAPSTPEGSPPDTSEATGPTAPGDRTAAEGCLLGTPCRLDATLRGDGWTVDVGSVNRQIGYSYLTFPDAVAVHAPADRQFVFLDVGVDVDGTPDGGTDDGAATAGVPDAESFALTDGSRSYPSGIDVGSAYGIPGPDGEFGYDAPSGAGRGWVVVPLPVPFDGDRLHLGVEGSDDRVALPDSLVAGVRDPPRFEIVSTEVPQAVSAGERVDVTVVVGNAGGSDGICPVVLNAANSLSIHRKRVPVPAGERRQRVLAATAEGAETLSPVLYVAGVHRELEVEVR